VAARGPSRCRMIEGFEGVWVSPPAGGGPAEGRLIPFHTSLLWLRMPTPAWHPLRCRRRRCPWRRVLLSRATSAAGPQRLPRLPTSPLETGKHQVPERGFDDHALSRRRARLVCAGVGDDLLTLGPRRSRRYGGKAAHAPHSTSRRGSRPLSPDER